ncbi:MAG: helix-turn-helix transcriptional regulator [Alphaproteobacteria bacterium]|nr:helix-turn-helix transcriptional regulator [Alphaproteobacteria bacterium]
MTEKILDKENFISFFSENLKKAIEKKFKTQKNFAEFINEPPQTINKWVKGVNLPDIYKLYKICESLDITIDFLVTGKNPDLSSINIDYSAFDEIVELVNDYAKKHKIKKISSAEYFSLYYAIAQLKELKMQKPSTKDAFATLESLFLDHLKKSNI